MSAAQDVLLAFVDYQDPYTRWLIGDEERPGPVLTLLAGRNFGRVVLFHTPHTRANAAETRQAIEEKHPQTRVNVDELRIANPKDYSAILAELAPRCLSLAGNPEERFWACSSSGTAEMRAAWYILASSGTLPARLLSVKWPRAGSTAPPEIIEVSTAGWFEQDAFTRRMLPSVEAPRRARSLALTALFRRRREAQPAPAAPMAEAAMYEIATEAQAEPPHPGLDEALEELGIFIGSASMRRAAESAAVLAGTSVPVLLIGETGTGKELYARLVHRLSDRSGAPMVIVNCAAIPANLAESQLFGHVKGAFTGATESRKGSFEDAHRGTLFLDEIGELPLEMQPKLLRAIEEGVIVPVGGKDKKVDVRLIAATNRDLNAEIKAGRFRQDLYHRLNLGEIALLPLRQRRAEIAHLALELLRRANLSFAKSPRRFSQGALERLEKHDWPGNVRELSNVIQRSVLFSRRELLDEGDLLLQGASGGHDPLAHLPEPAEGFDLNRFLDQVRRQLYLRAIEKAGRKQAEAARLLGVSRQAVSDFMRGLDSSA
jgi:DNA-binding NtrC family response regulator